MKFISHGNEKFDGKTTNGWTKINFAKQQVRPV